MPISTIFQFYQGKSFFNCDPSKRLGINVLYVSNPVLKSEKLVVEAFPFTVNEHFK